MRTGTAAELVLHDLLVLLPYGRYNAVAGARLAEDLGISERTLRSLVDELIDHGHLVGSACGSSELPAGYFIVESLEDLRWGTGHLVSRARSLNIRVARLRSSARLAFGGTEQQVLDLFDVDPKEDKP